MEPRTLTYRRPWLVRSFPVLLSLMAIADLVVMWIAVMAHPSPNYGVLLFFVLWFGGASLFLWRMSGPNDFYLDLDGKTYRYVTGWPVFAKTRTGPVSDLWGVYLGCTRRYGVFCVGVTWWGGKSNVTLERFGNKASAEQFAASLMSNLELKQVMPPRHLRPTT